MEKLGRDYDGLDLHGQKTVRAVADVEKARCSEAAQAAPAQTYDDIDRQVEDYRRLILEKNQAERLSPSNVDGTQTVSNKPAQPGGEYRRGLLMNNEEKILALLEQMQEELITIKDAQSLFDKRMDGLHESLFNAKTDILNIKTSLFTVKDDLQSVKLRLELDVEKRFDAVNASIDTVEKRLDTLDEMKELAEKTADKVDMIHAVVTQHSVAITELKKAE